MDSTSSCENKASEFLPRLENAMRSPILLTDEQRSLNLEMASEHLKEVFAKYPMPTKMDCCPHCAPDEDDLKAIYQGNSYMYLIKAMSTWGDEKDFKYFLPKALPYALGIREFEFLKWYPSHACHLPNYSHEPEKRVFKFLLILYTE